MPTALLYALIFAAALLVFDTLIRHFTGARRAKREVNERLARLNTGNTQIGSYEKLLSDRSATGGGRLEILGWLRRLYRQSGLTMPLSRRLAFVFGFLILCIIGARFFTSQILWQLVIGVGLCLALVLFILLRMRSKRIGKFVEQLPPAIDIIVRSLNAGHPLNAAIALVGREMPDPIGSEFGILSDQLTFGSELDDAMLSMIDRVGADELNLLAVTVSVQRGTGGNLSEILENLSGMIRDRGLMRAKIRAISAEGRITAMIMAVFPFGLYLIVRTIMPTYFNPIWESGYGTQVVLGVLTAMSIGILILYRLVKFDF